MLLAMMNESSDDGDEDEAEAEDNGHDGNENIHSNMVDGRDASATAMLSLTSVKTATMAIKPIHLRTIS